MDDKRKDVYKSKLEFAPADVLVGVCRNRDLAMIFTGINGIHFIRFTINERRRPFL